MMYQVVCQQCGQLQRWEIDIQVGGGIPKFCGCCGSRRVIQTKVDSYWYDLADEMLDDRSKEGAALIEELYKIWNANDMTFRAFVDIAKNLEVKLS